MVENLRALPIIADVLSKIVVVVGSTTVLTKRIEGGAVKASISWSALVTRHPPTPGVILPVPLTFFNDVSCFAQGSSRITSERDHAVLWRLLPSGEETEICCGHSPITAVVLIR